MGQPKTVWNHTIPLHYLRGFVIDDTNEVWLNYKRTNTNPNLPASHRASIKNTGTRKNFYSDEIEQMLASQIETPAAPVIAHIRKQIPPSPDERPLLAKYIINFLNRVEYGRHKFLSQLPSMYDKHFTEANLESLLERKPSVEEILKFMEIRKRWEGNSNKDMEFWGKLLLPSSLPRASSCLEQMRWQFLVTPSPSFRFLTCDNPVFYFGDLGIGHPLSELSFPISSHITLWASFNLDLQEGFFTVDPMVVDEINSRTVANATNRIFSSINGGWIKKLAMRSVVRPRRIVTRYGKHHSIPKLA